LNIKDVKYKLPFIFLFPAVNLVFSSSSKKWKNIFLSQRIENKTSKSDNAAAAIKDFIYLFTQHNAIINFFSNI